MNTQEVVANLGLWLSYLLLGIALLVALAFMTKSLMNEKEGAKISAIAIGSLLLIFGLAYGIASDEVLPSYKEFNIDASLSRLIGAMINTMWITLGAAGLIFAYAQINSMIKK